MSCYSELMTILCKQYSKTPTPLLVNVIDRLINARAQNIPPRNVLQMLRDTLATTYNIQAVDEFIVSGVLMVALSEVENRRIADEAKRGQ